MDKKAHIYASNFMYDFLKNNGITNCKKTIMLGNLFPDLKPSFITVKHNLEATEKTINKLLYKIQNNYNKINKRCIFTICQIIHYISDYFTAPHNPELWNKNLYQHIMYERKQHIELRNYIINKEFIKDIKNFDFKKNINTTDELFEEIKKIHKEQYLIEKKSIKNDIKYIICIIHNTLIWILNKIFNYNKLSIQ